MKNGIIKELVYLFLGCLLTAVAVVFMVNSKAGLSPWDVLHQGLSKMTVLTMGQASMLVGVLVIISSTLLGENLGWGTIANIFVPGVLIDVIDNLHIIPVANNVFTGLIMLIIGLIIMSIATVLYLKPALGCGPRDGLMMAIHKKTNKPIGLLRGIIEVSAVVVGYFMGGTVGIGTILAAFCFGYILEFTFKIFKYEPKNVEHKMIFDYKRKKVA